jgi:hypothetical protein
MKPKRPWGGQKTTSIVLACIVLLSAGASVAARRSGLPGGLRLGTGWFFHIAFGVFIFVVLYALAALLTATVLAGGPPTKMSGLGFSWDWETALQIANSGAESLEELNKRLSGLQDQVAALVAVERETQGALVFIADALPTAPSAVKVDALMRSQRLGQLLEQAKWGEDQASAAIAGFRANLVEIERLHEEMTRT